MIGDNILHYCILEKIGEGGMGEVYLAEDIALARKVALKFLPQHYISDADLNKRFRREAKAAAALNHPNIVTIHEIGELEGRVSIAMEYVEGESLRDIVKATGRSPLPIDQILNIVIQICEGLSAAHQTGIIHRDVKPENIIIDKTGRVRILDFGLAGMAGVSKLTKAGSTLGTVSYMSPEQFRSEPVDQRTDLWSLGVVLYEMLTGQLPFQGEYEQAVMYQVLNEEPQPVAKLRDDVPEILQQIVTKALSKRANARCQNADELLADLRELQQGKASGISAKHTASAGTTGRAPLSKRAFVYGGLAVVAALVIAYNLFQQKISTPKIVQVHALTNTTAVSEGGPMLSPDGTKIAYDSDEDGKNDLWVRQLASGQTMNLTKDEKSPTGGHVWSPDGNWIAYVSARNGGGIYVTSDYGGAVRKVVAHNFEDLGGLDWSPDGKKLVYTVKGKLHTVLASGGIPEPIPCPQEVFWPEWSPDGQRIALISGAAWSSTRQQGQRLWSIRADGSDAIAVTDSTIEPQTPFWAHDGKRIFFKWNRGGVRDIWWVPVDKNGRPAGSAKPLSAGLDAYDFSLSNDGSRLAYSTGGHDANIWSIHLETDRVLTMDDAVQITHENNMMWNLAMSPDHKWFAFTSGREGHSAIWLARKDGQMLRQLTTDNSSNHFSPSWSPDGSRIAFSSNQTGNWDVYTKPVDGGPVTALAANSADVDAFPAWSPDGERIVFNSNRSGNYDVWETSLSSGETRQLTDHQADDGDPRYSPDGRFISFASNRGGTFDLYLMPASGGEAKQLTNVGSPKWVGHVWSQDSKTIYLRHYDPGKSDPKVRIQAVSVPDGSMRKVLDLDNIAIEVSWASMATDGEKLYFIQRRPFGDIWLAELMYE